MTNIYILEISIQIDELANQPLSNPEFRRSSRLLTKQNETRDTNINTLNGSQV